MLILDEPSANMDVRAEAALFDAFLDVTAGTTSLLISHRLWTCRRASRICLIDGGRLVEDGTHDQLIAIEGQYAALFNAQAAQFVGVA